MLFNNVEVDYRAEIYFNEYHQGIIIIYGVSREDLPVVESGEHKSMVILLESKEYISAFDLYVKERSYNTKMVDEVPEFDGGKIVAVSSDILKGKNCFIDEDA